MSAVVAPPSGSDLTDRYATHLARWPGAGTQLQTLRERSSADPALRSVTDAPLLPRPLFLSADERDGLERDLAALQAILLSLPERLYGGDVLSLCEDVGFAPTQAMLIDRTMSDTTMGDDDAVLSRADLIRGADGFRLIELNVHSSLGGLDAGPWHRAMNDVPAFADFARRERLSFVDPLDGVAGVLRAAARRRDLNPYPRVALVDWPTSYPATAARLTRLAALLGRRGLDAVACSAADLRTVDGHLTVDGRRIDVVYRIFVLVDVLSDPSLVWPILRAHEAGTAVLAMGFGAELAGNKGCLAMLFDPARTDRFSAAEHAVIQRLVPWTGWVDAAAAGSAWVAAERHELVLKPAAGYSASGVVGGWSVDAAQWRQALEAAVGQHFVLQRRVRAVAETMPRPDGDAVRADVVSVDANWGVFLAGGRYNGAMIRAVPSASEELITTSTGASIGCCFTQRRAAAAGV